MEFLGYKQDHPKIQKYITWNLNLKEKNSQLEFDKIIPYFQKKTVNLCLFFPVYHGFGALARFF
jgi:hypothetical protein